MIKDMTPEEKLLALGALRQHDGHTLCPELPWEEQCAVSRALDKVRAELAADEHAIAPEYPGGSGFYGQY